MKIDVIIVGAGAAGVAAGRRLASRGRSTLLIEALSRPGGRAFTFTVEGLPLDLGCGWLHSAERNAWARFAEAEGVQIDRTPARWGDQLRNLGFSAAQQEEAAAACSRFAQRLRQHQPTSDRALDAVDTGERWTPYLQALSGFLNGAELDCLSVADYLTYDDAASETNWRLPDGYGALVARAADRLPMALDTTVTAIDHSGTDIRLETDKGPIRARAAIVAVSTAVLARGDIRFTPTLDRHLHAAACLPLGLADKLFLAIADVDAVPADTHLLGDPHDARTGSYYLRPFGRPVIECFFGGAGARALEREGPAAAEAFAIGQLRALLGSDFARGLCAIAGLAWGAVPTIGGSYSHALPGHADARATLAAPPSSRLAFAGEACSLADFTTAHGAWESGVAAADHVERAL